MAYSAIDQITATYEADLKVTNPNGKPEHYTRYFGGHSRTGHPYVNGYWQLFIAPPKFMFGDDAGKHAVDWIHATAEGFTPPSRNLNKADLPGQGGVGSSWVTGQSLQRTFSITHREYRDMPMAQIYQLWTSIIVPQFGVSEFTGTDWKATSYKGHAMVIFTKPTGDTKNSWQIDETGSYSSDKDNIEDVWYFDGVWPENQPWDALAQDISSNDIVQYTINFSFDGWPLNKTDKNVLEQAKKVLNSLKYETTYEIYNDYDLKTMERGPVAPVTGA